MKLNEKYTINQEFEELFSFENDQNKSEHDAKMLMFKFLSEVENIDENKKIKKKDLAHALGTSPSYITQLFRGDKLANLMTLAKLQDIFEIEFDIRARSTKSPAIVPNIYNENIVARPVIDNSSFGGATYSTKAKESYLKLVV